MIVLIGQAQPTAERVHQVHVVLAHARLRVAQAEGRRTSAAARPRRLPQHPPAAQEVAPLDPLWTAWRDNRPRRRRRREG